MNVTIAIPPWATHIVSDHTDMERNPHPVDATKVSKFTFALPDDAYFEYAFLDGNGDMKPDPENGTAADNPWYPRASAIFGPDYRADPYAGLGEEVAGGVAKRHRLDSAILAQTRRLIVYTPRGRGGEALPCLYLQDGVAYYRLAKLHLVMEKLLSDGLIRPAHLVFVEPKKRRQEYGFNPSYEAFMVEELLSFVEDKLETTGERLAMGASLGGLVSALLAWKHPELFATVITQSGAFLGSPEKPNAYRNEASWLLERVQQEGPKPLRWYSECGTLEWLIEVNRELARALDEGGYDYDYKERNAGHNWVNWRNGLSGALRFALPPQP